MKYYPTLSNDSKQALNNICQSINYHTPAELEDFEKMRAYLKELAKTVVESQDLPKINTVIKAITNFTPIYNKVIEMKSNHDDLVKERSAKLAELANSL